MATPSRLNRFFKTVASSSAVTATGFVTTLIATPVILYYLPKKEFALWALLTQIVGYVGLMDFGMSPALARLLIDHKDQPQRGEYGSLIKTGVLVGATQGLLILVLGGLLAAGFASILEIPAELRGAFVRLIRWQLVITAGTFATRFLRHILHAQNRNDLTNYGQVLASLVNLAAMWWGLRRGFGIYSVLWANLLSLVVLVTLIFFACRQLGFFPKPGYWGKLSWYRFQELFVYGRDVFLVHIGSQLIVATQSAMISRRLGLEAVAAWAIATDVFFALCGLLWQIFDYSTPVLAEMIVRGEQPRLRQRFLDLLIVTLSLSAVAGVILTATNSAFVSVWTAGRITWPVTNDVWLGLWVLPLVWVHMECSFVLLTKKLAALRYIYVVEGVIFVVTTLWLLPYGGIPIMIAISIVSSILFSGSYGSRRNRQFFGLSLSELEFRWLVPVGKILACLVPVAAGLMWWTVGFSPLTRFLIRGLLLAGAGTVVFVRFGIPVELRNEALGRLPGRWRKSAAWVLGERRR